MMSKKTAEILAQAREFFGDRKFSEQEWRNAHLGLTLETACAYGVKVHTIVTRTYYSVEWIVNELNECSGEDCYNGHWHYKIDEQGHIYEDRETYVYQMKKEEA